jgi:hypothetical protein
MCKLKKLSEFAIALVKRGIIGVKAGKKDANCVVVINGISFR